MTVAENGPGSKAEVTDALSHSTTYDADSNSLSVTDGNSHTSNTMFDNDCRRLVVTKANGDTFTYAAIQRSEWNTR